MPPATLRQIDAVANWADQYSYSEIRIGHEQNFVLPHVPEANLFELWQQATAVGLGGFNMGLLSDRICCPGGDSCSR